MFALFNKPKNIAVAGSGSIRQSDTGLVLRVNGEPAQLPWYLTDMVTKRIVAKGLSSEDGVHSVISGLDRNRSFRFNTFDPNGKYLGNGSYDWIFPK